MSFDHELDEFEAIAAKVAETGDEERDHSDADDALIECLRWLASRIDNTEPVRDRMVPAVEALVARFEALPKWYA